MEIKAGLPYEFRIALSVDSAIILFITIITLFILFIFATSAMGRLRQEPVSSTKGKNHTTTTTITMAVTI